MITQVETLDEAIQSGLKINAIYIPNGEVVKILYDLGAGEIEFQDGTIDRVSINDLTDFTWE